VREGRCRPALAARARAVPEAWALPGGLLEPGETLEASIRRHLAAKVDVREVSHLEQLATYSDPGANPTAWELATAYLGLVELGLDPDVPGDTRWHPVDDLPPMASTTARSCSPAASGCAGSSRTRTRASRSRPPTSRSPSCARSTSRRSGTTSRPRTSAACSSARAVIEPTASGARPAGRRPPAEVFRFRDRHLRDHRPVRGAPAAPLTLEHAHPRDRAHCVADREAERDGIPSATTASSTGSERSIGSR
jgi:8-oxo-dGTP diphosphatase